jgi:hypothetical protein
MVADAPSPPSEESVLVIDEHSETEKVPPTPKEGKGKRRASPESWPQALTIVRGWLEPYVMLRKYWRAFSGMPPPPKLRRLLERVYCGEGLYLYVH